MRSKSLFIEITLILIVVLSFEYFGAFESLEEFRLARGCDGDALVILLDIWICLATNKFSKILVMR